MIPETTAVRFLVGESSAVGEARRAAVQLAEALGFDETECGKVALVVAEAAKNLVRHAEGGGEIILQASENGVLDILALDKGPGMANIAACLRDGYSTAGTPGTGLGAIARLSPVFDIFSQRPGGTALLSRFPGSEKRGEQLEIGAFALPLPGETACGDAWAAADEEGRTRLLVADGLGHGPVAAEASRTAVRVFREQAARGLPDILQALHAALHATRGAAVAVADVDYAAGVVRYAGLGNIQGAVVSADDTRHMVSQNGTVGHQARRVQEFTYPLPPGALVLLISDGLTTQWRLERYPGLLTRHPALVAGVLYRDFSRGRDDATVLVARREDTEATPA